MPELFDTHAHLDFKDFDRDREDVIARARAAGVRYMITVGSGGGAESMGAAAAIAAAHVDMWATVGVHPHDAKIMSDDILVRMRELAGHEKVVGIGEIGLDWAKMYSPRDEQLKWFRDQLALAREVGLPVVVHDRDAHEDVLRVFREDGVGEAGGVMHCYSGTADLARELVGMGFYISFSGTVTYPDADGLRAAARAVPADRIMVETDCPFLMPRPRPQKDRRNEPAFVKFTAERVARERGVSLDDFAAQTTKNAFSAFSLRF